MGTASASSSQKTLLWGLLFICSAGHMATQKARTGKKNQGRNQVLAYFFDIEKCKVCPLREGCYKEGAKS